MKDKIVVVGSSNIDLIMKMDHLPEVGETVTDAVFNQVYGGKGANQAVAAARAGADVSFISCIGEDAYTPMMVENYKKDGIDTRFIFSEKGKPSGHALIMIGDQGNNYISVAPGANYSLKPDRIDKAVEVFEEASIVLLQFEILAETNKHVIELANKNRIPVIFNFAPAREFDTEYIGRSDYLILNEVEAEFLSGIKISDKGSAEKAALALIKNGTDTVIITLGSQGSMAFRKNEKYFVPAYRVEAIDTTAAGDVFCGSFSVAVTEGKNLEESIRFANAAAALSVTKMGAQPSAPDRKEIENFIKNH